MVIVNTNKQTYPDLRFNYLQEVPATDCLFCSGREVSSGRARLFLVFNGNGKVYRRNGLKGTWEEIENSAARDQIRELVKITVQSKSAPYFHGNDFYRQN